MLQGVAALQEGEVPVGCIIVQGDKVIARGYNKTNASKNVCIPCNSNQ